MTVMDRRRLSKALAYHLRQREVPLLPGRVGACVDDVIAVLRPPPTREAFAAVVSDGDRPRFELSDDGHLIRARYGHSRDVDLAYVPAHSPTRRALPRNGAQTVAVLCANGIHRRGRRFVHLSEHVDTAREVGGRHGSPGVVRVAARRMYDDGNRFVHAAAGTWLTDSVPPRYITRVDG